MVDLDFMMEDLKVEQYAASPTLLFVLRITNRTPALPVHAVMLNCQLRIEPTRRLYSAAEHGRLSDLFGEPARWRQTLQSLVWTRTSVTVPSFDLERTVELPVACSYDFNIAATKYFDGIEEGEIPVSLLFSGSVFYRDQDEHLQIDQIPWTKECSYRLPIQTWRAMMECYYPQSAWLCIRRDAFERLHRYKREHNLHSFEQALDQLLEGKMADVAP